MKELVKIQGELKAPKGQVNQFGNYKYRSCEDILEAVKPLLKANGCYINLSDKMVEVGGRVYVKALATITNGEGVSVTASAYAREAETQKGMSDSQVTGSASSYARKYALNGLLAIDDEKDDDTRGSEKASAKPVKTTSKIVDPDAPASEAQLNWVRKIASNMGKKDIDFDTITKAQASELINKYGNRV